MIINVYARTDDIVEATSNDNKNIISLSDSINYPRAGYLIQETRVPNKFYGNNCDVVKEYYSPHKYEAKNSYEVIKNFNSMIKFKPKLSFVGKQQQGFKVDISRYISGDQRCFFNMRKRRSTIDSVRIFAPIGGTYNIKKKQLVYNGALSCIISEIFEYNNINVEIYAGCKVMDCIKINGKHGIGEDIITLIKIKDSNEYCDYGKINYITGNDHFYRNIVFRSRALNCLEYNCDIANGLGRSTDIIERDLCGTEIEISDSDIFLPRVYSEMQLKMFVDNFILEKKRKEELECL